MRIAIASKTDEPSEAGARRVEHIFVLSEPFAARYAAACALRGDDANDVLADLLVEFCEEVEDEAARCERGGRP